MLKAIEPVQDTVPNMPNILHSKVSMKSNSSNPLRPSPQGPPDVQSHYAMQQEPQPLPDSRQQQRNSSATSSHSSRDDPNAVDAFYGAALLDCTPDQHALNSLDGLHAQTQHSSSATGLPVTRTAPSRQPSRGNSSVSSSRPNTGSVFPLDEEAEAVANALTLKGMSLT